MTRRTENRIWRGLFLVTIAGIGIAATSHTAPPKAVSIAASSSGPQVLFEDGSVYGAARQGSKNVWVQFLGPPKRP